MNKNIKSTSRTKKAPAKATKTTKTRATKTAAKTTKSKTAKSAATKPRATKTWTRKAKESSPPEELPRDKSPELSDNESSDNETYDKLPGSSGLSTNNILDMAAMLKQEAQLEKLRQYYYAHKEAIHKDQNSKYSERREKEKNDPELLEKQRQACKNYYHQNKDKILPKIKKDTLKNLSRKKVLKYVLLVEKQKSRQLNAASNGL